MTHPAKPPRSVWCWRINGGPWIATKSRAIADACKIEGLPVQQYDLHRPKKAQRRCSESVERAVAMERCALALEDAGMDKAASVVRDYAKSCSRPAKAKPRKRRKGAK